MKKIRAKEHAQLMEICEKINELIEDYIREPTKLTKQGQEILKRVSGIRYEIERTISRY